MTKLIAGYLPGTGKLYPFDAIFDEAIDVSKEGLDSVNCLILWGGEDISPDYYGQPAHRFTDSKNGPSARDLLEWRAMKYAAFRGIPIIGVCRGAQFACVFAGGKLIQHVVNHHQSHKVLIRETSEVMETSSCHHQMMYPYAMKSDDYEILAVAHKKRSHTYQDGDNKEIQGMLALDEPEAVFFPKIRALAIQGHPEWMQENDPYVAQCNEWVVEKLMLNQTTDVEGVL